MENSKRLSHPSGFVFENLTVRYARIPLPILLTFCYDVKMNTESILKEIITQFSTLENIDAICLGGSRIGSRFDEKSDFDIYIYSKTQVDLNFRKQLAKKYAKCADINAQFFGTGDEWVLDNGIIFDFMYFDTNWLRNEIEEVFKNHNAKVGYSTCFLYTFKNSKILFDKNKEFENAQKQLQGPYPKNLKQAIVEKNYPLLKTKLCASFFEQIEKAVNRKDYFSVNHRISAYLASYFDVLFAINKQFHPGEKKLVEFAKTHCSILPEDFENDIKIATTGELPQRLLALENLFKNLNLILNK